MVAPADIQRIAGVIEAMNRTLDELSKTLTARLHDRGVSEAEIVARLAGVSKPQHE